MTFGGQDRTEAVARIGVDRDGEAEPFQPGLDRRRQVASHVRHVRRVLRGAGDRDQRRQPVAETVAVEKRQRAPDRGLPGCHSSTSAKSADCPIRRKTGGAQPLIGNEPCRVRRYGHAGATPGGTARQ